jgi:hypothetical protein
MRASKSVPVLTREQFLEKFGEDYAPGQHVTFIGPTQRGKTHMSHQMLERVISPQLPALILAGKPPGRDHTMDEAPDKLGLQVTETFPPPANVKARQWWNKRTSETPKANGYVLKPRHTMTDLSADKANLGNQFRKGMVHSYAGSQNIIVVCDETKLIYDLKLQEEHEAILTRGAPVVACWSLLQRGRFVSYFVYDMPEHVIFFSDPDSANVKRYAELVGGVDPKLIVDTMNSLKTRESANKMTNSEAIYFRRSGSQIAIVTMD